MFPLCPAPHLASKHAPFATTFTRPPAARPRLQSMPRPFKKLRELDMEELVASIAKDLKSE